MQLICNSMLHSQFPRYGVQRIPAYAPKALRRMSGKPGPKATP